LKAIITSELDDLVSLAVVRSLGKKNIDFAVASKYERAFVFHSKYCKNFLVTNLDLDFFSKLSKNVMIFPMDEDIMCQVSKNKNKLACSLAFPEYNTLKTVANKSWLIRHAIEHDIPCPKTFFITRSEDVKKCEKIIEYPAVLRQNTGYGGKGISFVHSLHELHEVEKNFFKLYGSHMIQEKIPFLNKYTVGVLCNADSQVRRICVIKEIRNYPVETGPACYVETVHYPELVDLSVKLMESLNYFGIADIDFLIDKRTGEPKLMEINPRFWGSLQVAIDAGVDFPSLLYELMCNGDIKKSFDYKTGVRCRHVIIDDLLRLLSILRGHYTVSYKLTTIIDFLRINPHDGYYIFSLDDLKPFKRHVLNKIIKNLSIKNESQEIA
jgi:predicted ATP-grasp superfamily ATP-dependent carboligase